jgi:hypothetical protein
MHSVVIANLRIRLRKTTLGHGTLPSSLTPMSSLSLVHAVLLVSSRQLASME